MKKVLMLVFIGAVALMGYYDGGDMTAAVVLGLLFLPSLLERNEKNGKRSFDYVQDDRV